MAGNVNKKENQVREREPRRLNWIEPETHCGLIIEASIREMYTFWIIADVNWKSYCILITQIGRNKNLLFMYVSVCAIL